MSNKAGYEQQHSLSFAQFISKTLGFVLLLVSAILSKTILVFVDLLDSFGNLLRVALVTILSKKLSKDLRYEYNYGVGKIEAIASLLCDGILFFCLFLTLGLSVYAIIFPGQPNDLVIGVVVLKIVTVSFDITVFIKQRKILKTHHSAISQNNYAAALAALLFDSVTLVSLFVMWLLRNGPIGAYISPVISIFIAAYLMIGCGRRTKSAIEELTDKTLPEDQQMKILNTLIRFFHSYSQVYSVKSHKSGDEIIIDLHLSFEKGTPVEEIAKLNKQMQEEFDRQFENCIVNIIVANS